MEDITKVEEKNKHQLRLTIHYEGKKDEELIWCEPCERRKKKKNNKTSGNVGC